MTPEFIKQICKALAVICVFVGGLGCISCVPFAFTNNLFLLATTGIYFVAGGIMIVGGLNAYVQLHNEEHKPAAA